MQYDDDDENPPAVTQAFGALKEHSNKYKMYLDRLKEGRSSGISRDFGRAADLLPPEQLNNYVKTYRVGESIFSEEIDQNELRAALEEVITLFKNEGIAAEEEAPGQPDTGRQVIGVLFEDGRKKYLYSDHSVEDAPAEMDADEHGQLESAESAGPGQEGAPAERLEVRDAVESALPERAPGQEIDHHTDEGADKGEPGSLISPALPDEARMPTPDEIVAGGPASIDARSSAGDEPGRPPANQADLHVVSLNGDWLWDIRLDDDMVSEVIMSDGTTIQQVQADQYVVTCPPPQGKRMPQVMIVDTLLCDLQTGNLYYQSAGGDHAVALLNNGWKIDQFRKPGGGEEFYVTEPLRPGQDRLPTMVSNLKLDPETGEATYDTIDGAASVTLRSRILG